MQQLSMRHPSRVESYSFKSDFLKEIKFGDATVKLCETVSIDDARTLAKSSMKAKLPLIECPRTPKAIGYDKTFYANIGEAWVLVAIKGENAIIIPIPGKPLEIIWNCYIKERNNDPWKWWSMGWGFPMMIENLIDQFNCIKFEIKENALIGYNRQGMEFTLTINDDHYPKPYSSTDTTIVETPTETTKPKKKRTKNAE